jgi:hypothetical protein
MGQEEKKNWGGKKIQVHRPTFIQTDRQRETEKIKNQEYKNSTG